MRWESSAGRASAAAGESTQLQRPDDWFYGAVRNQFWTIRALVYDRPLRWP